MKARVLLAIVALALVSACSAQPLTTLPDKPQEEGVGTVGSGH